MGRDLSCSSEHPSPVALGWLGVSGWVPQELDSETEVSVQGARWDVNTRGGMKEVGLSRRRS